MASHTEKKKKKKKKKDKKKRKEWKETKTKRSKAVGRRVRGECGSPIRSRARGAPCARVREWAESLSLSRPCVCARLSALVLPSRERAVARESSVCCCVRSGQCARLRKQKQKKNLLLSLCYKTFKEKYKSVCFCCGRWTQTTGGTR